MTDTRTEDRDLGWEEIKKDLENLDVSYVDVGIHEDAGDYPDGTPISRVALYNEFGTRRGIPSRPFFRKTVDEKEDAIFIAIEAAYNAVLARTISPKIGLERIGFTMKEMIQGMIQTAAQWAKPLKPATIARKLRGGALRGPTPLIQTELMFRAVQYKVKVKE